MFLYSNYCHCIVIVTCIFTSRFTVTTLYTVYSDGEHNSFAFKFTMNYHKVTVYSIKIILFITFNVKTTFIFQQKILLKL